MDDPALADHPARPRALEEELALSGWCKESKRRIEAHVQATLRHVYGAMGEEERAAWLTSMNFPATAGRVAVEAGLRQIAFPWAGHPDWWGAEPPF